MASRSDDGGGIAFFVILCVKCKIPHPPFSFGKRSPFPSGKVKAKWENNLLGGGGGIAKRWRRRDSLAKKF